MRLLISVLLALVPLAAEAPDEKTVLAGEPFAVCRQERAYLQ
jgi:hypothetical protein